MAQGESDGRVRVHSVSRREVVAEFGTVFGGVLGRLALSGSPENGVLVAGGWAKDGIAAYQAQTGALPWRRRDLPEAYALGAAGDGGSVAVSFERAPMQVLDINSGESLAQVKGIRAYRQSPYGPIGAAQLDGTVSLLDASEWRLGARLPIREFAMLEAAFAPTACLVSDTTDPDASILSSVVGPEVVGELHWRVEIPRFFNVPWLAWHAASGGWLGVSRHVDRLSADILHGWSVHGEELFRRPLDGHPEYAFTVGGDLPASR